MRLGTLRMRLANRAIEVAGLIPLPDGEQILGETQRCGPIFRPQPHRLMERRRSILMLPLRGLHPPEVVEPSKRAGVEQVSPLIAGGGCVVLLVGVQDHAQSPAGLGVLRIRLGRGIRLADLLANGWKEVVEIQPRKVRERLAACRSGCACGEGEGKNQQDRDRHATL